VIVSKSAEGAAGQVTDINTSCDRAKPDIKGSYFMGPQEATLEEAREALQGEHLKTTRVMDL
jgi:hypothetical protein